MGIVLAAGMIPLALIGSAVIGGILLLFANKKSSDNPFIVVLSCTDRNAEQNARAYLEQNTKGAAIKGKTARPGSIEMNYEVRLKDGNTDFITILSQIEGVNSAVLVSYTDDYLG